MRLLDQNWNKLRSMAEMTSFSYGDEVLVIKGEHTGKPGAIVGVNGSDLPSVFTVEFGDGSDEEVPVDCLKASRCARSVLPQFRDDCFPVWWLLGCTSVPLANISRKAVFAAKRLQ